MYPGDRDDRFLQNARNYVSEDAVSQAIRKKELFQQRMIHRIEVWPSSNLLVLALILTVECRSGTCCGTCCRSGTGAGSGTAGHLPALICARWDYTAPYFDGFYGFADHLGHTVVTVDMFKFLNL
jgi:hypothetical protein